MINPIMKIGNITKSLPETVTRVRYERAPYTMQVETVKIGAVKTCQVKRMCIGDKLLSAVIHIFDKDGKRIGKQKIK